MSRRTIWKYPLQVTDHQTVDMPMAASILCVQVQSGQPCLWALVNPDMPKEQRGIVIHGTGHGIVESAGRYIGTFQLERGALVFHAFERRNVGE